MGLQVWCRMCSGHLCCLYAAVLFVLLVCSRVMEQTTNEPAQR